LEFPLAGVSLELSAHGQIRPKLELMAGVPSPQPILYFAPDLNKVPAAPQVTGPLDAQQHKPRKEM
jgi:hypothetical protein